MPRLLLVDDNPSIHRIAESLLAPTDIELICADSAAEALDRLERGERFDVALVDTAMPGMDGWALLTRLRAMEATAQMPIALMAGVLDPVDPAKLAKAPIQGFLKKPIELRELGDRVKALLATPVVVALSPFSTVPATSAKDLIRHAEAALPEYRSDRLPEPAEDLAFVDSLEPEPEPVEADLLMLGAEDLWPEEPELPGVSPLPVVPEVHLDLEELDLESLQDLTEEPLAESVQMIAPEVPEPFIASVPVTDDDALVTLSGLEELDMLGAPTPDAPVFMVEPESVIPEPILFEPEPEPEPEVPFVPEPSFAGTEPFSPDLLAVPAVPAAGGQMPAAEGQPPSFPGVLGTGTADQAQVQGLLQALLADPVLVDALVKAVVARMGDQVLREIAWEVMPDLAGRLQR